MRNSFRQYPFLNTLVERISFDKFPKWVLPVCSLLVLAIACQDSDFNDGRALARLFSGQYYRLFIVFGVTLMAAFAIRSRSLRPILGCVLLIVSCLILTNILKYSFHLGRPPRISHGVVEAGFSPGFPSAHTAFIFGLAWLLALRLPFLSCAWFGFAVAVGWSRIELQSHYPYQVLAGALLGLALGYWIGEKQGTIFPRLPFCPIQPEPNANITPTPISETHV